MGKKRKPVELIKLLVKCPTTNEEIMVDVKTVSFRGWDAQCNLCGGHAGVDMDIGICPSCNDTHPVTVLMEY